MKNLRLALCLLLVTAPFGFGQSNKSAYNILFDGNSWVAGSGSTAGSNYPNQVQSILQKAGKTVTLLNTGVPGQTIDKMQANAPTKVDPHHAQCQYLIGLELVNQWGQTDLSREVIFAKYQNYFLDRKAAGFQNVIALTPIAQGHYPRKNWEEDRQWFITKMLAEFPKQGITVANIGGDPRLSDWKNTKYYGADKIHPNNAGYAVIAEIVAKTLLAPTKRP
ncbi:MAG: SGNH/GDSL hydrolase family protein [Verrucomicrobiota bacterium]